MIVKQKLNNKSAKMRGRDKFASLHAKARQYYGLVTYVGIVSHGTYYMYLYFVDSKQKTFQDMRRD